MTILPVARIELVWRVIVASWYVASWTHAGTQFSNGLFYTHAVFGSAFCKVPLLQSTVVF